jgi:hypothetical protein
MGHAFVGSLIDKKTMVLKNIGTRGNTQGTTWTTPSLSQYNSRRVFVNKF